MISSPVYECYTDEQIATHLEISDETLNFFKDLCENPMLSIDEPVSNESDIVVGDYIRDFSINVENAAIDSVTYDEICNLMDSILSEKELSVIKKRCGLTNGKIYTLQEIADEFVPAVTRERIRQIENTAIWKLRKNPFIIKILRDVNPSLYKVVINSAPASAQASLSYKKGKARTYAAS